MTPSTCSRAIIGTHTSDDSSGGVPGTWAARGSSSGEFTISPRPVRATLPVMPSPTRSRIRIIWSRKRLASQTTGVSVSPSSSIRNTVHSSTSMTWRTCWAMVARMMSRSRLLITAWLTVSSAESRSFSPRTRATRVWMEGSAKARSGSPLNWSCQPATPS